MTSSVKPDGWLVSFWTANSLERTQVIKKFVNAWGLLRRGLLLNQIRWDLARGEETLRLNYDLDDKSLVFDLGGFEGDWAAAICNKYGCTVRVFEPIDQFAGRIEQRFTGNKAVLVHRFGLADETKDVPITVDGISSSVFIEGEAKQMIKLVKATDFMCENAITNIDLMKINIQGGEFDLLDHLIASHFIDRIKNVQVQFHDHVPNARERMRKIQQDLSKTHFLTYQYLFVFENWRIRQVQPHLQ